MRDFPFRCAAFDMDGTLLDSMSFWREAAVHYLQSHGVRENMDALRARLREMSSLASMDFIRPICEAAHIPPMQRADLMRHLEACYRTRAVAKPGIPTFLAELRRAGIPMCVATATPEALARVALRKAGILDDFAFILTPETYPKGKSDRAFFDGISARFGVPLRDIAVVEDALYSMRTAKSVGCYCIGAAEDYSAAQQAELRALCDAFYDFSVDPPVSVRTKNAESAKTGSAF